MVSKKGTSPEKLLTEVELALMQAVWALGECTVKEVQTALLPLRPLAYTSVATMMKILEQKRFLTNHKSERAHTYRATLGKVEYEARTLKHLAENLFQGDPSSMVMRLISDADLSTEELKSIRALLNERLRS